MSRPSIPDITPLISLTREDSVNMILASIAMQEMGISHIIDAEAKKILYVLRILHNKTHAPPKLEEIHRINCSVHDTIKELLRLEMLLQSKLETVKAFSKLPPDPPPDPSPNPSPDPSPDPPYIAPSSPYIKDDWEDRTHKYRRLNKVFRRTLCKKYKRRRRCVKKPTLRRQRKKCLLRKCRRVYRVCRSDKRILKNVTIIIHSERGKIIFCKIVKKKRMVPRSLKGRRAKVKSSRRLRIFSNKKLLSSCRLRTRPLL